MPCLTITTPKGELVAEHHVADDQVVVVLHQWFSLLTSSDVAVAVDGARVPEDDKQRILAHNFQPNQQSSLPEPALLDEYAKTLHGAFERIIDAEWKVVQRQFEFTTRIADELTRQRQMMHQTIRDVDAVDRAIVATNQADRFAARINAATNAGTSGKPTINYIDILHGISEVIHKQGETPNE